jgi:hypothetical protein
MARTTVTLAVAVALALAPAAIACSTAASAPPGSPPDADASTTSEAGVDAATDGAATDAGAHDVVTPPGDTGTPPGSSWTPNPPCGQAAPNLGPNVLVFDPSMSIATIQSQISAVDAKQDGAQFGTGRYAYLFKPGSYALDVRVGFYMQVLGLGHTPDDTTITGAVRAKADWFGGNATLNFWRGVENLAAVPATGIDGNAMVWAVSQGTHLRRVHVHGPVHLSDGGNSSGGFIADSLVDGVVSSGSQQQFLTRNDDMGWNGGAWNMVFVGDAKSPTGTWPSPPFTAVTTTPVIRERPFLYVDPSSSYAVMMPALKKGSAGHSWASGDPPGSPVCLDRFYVASPGTDTASTMNAALAAGKHLLLTPGTYALEASLQVAAPDTIVMGLGFPTLLPKNGTAAVTVADVDGVTLAGFLMDAGPTSSPTLLQVGPPASSQSHAAAPTAIFDVHCRVGGAQAGTTASCVTVNSHDVLIDDMWLWRADHGAGASWTGNPSDTGIVVNGDDVTAYGLFVEHHQKFQTLWNGNGGATYFYQSEMPYDPPSQSAWKDPAGHDGYASYKVADTVTTHTAAGLGVYAIFDNAVSAENAVEAPTAAGVSVHHIVTVNLRQGGITHQIDDTGPSVGNGTSMAWSTN